MDRPSIFLEWQRLVDKYNDMVQQLKVDNLTPDARLKAELLLEKKIIVGIRTVGESLALSGAFEEELHQ